MRRLLSTSPLRAERCCGTAMDAGGHLNIQDGLPCFTYSAPDNSSLCIHIDNQRTYER